MSDLFRLSDDQMRRIAPYFPLPPGVLRVDDRRIVSGIIVVIGNGLLAGRPCGLLSGQDDLHRFIRWSRMGCLTGYWRDWRSGVPDPRRPTYRPLPGTQVQRKRRTRIGVAELAKIGRWPLRST